MTRLNKLTVLAAAVALSVGLAACGGGSSTTTTEMTPQEKCEAAGGTYADGTCTTAAQLAAMAATAADEALKAAKTAVDAVDDESTAAEVADADTAVADAKAKVAAASAADNHAALSERLGTIQGALAEKKQSRMTAMDDAAKAATAAMAATAAKLYAGISAQMGAGDGTTFADTDRDAFYNNDATAILVSIGDGTNTPTAVSATLSEDKTAMVAANHGWAGKRYADPAGGDMYEAMVYSNVEAPKMGRKFGSAAAVTPTGAYEYELTAGALPSSSFEAKNVAFTGVTRTAGTETFNLPDPNPSGADIIIIPGSYHGVPGTYSCTPADAATGCSAAVAAEGFTVSTADTWTFKPTNAEARVTDAADIHYASYGWWIKKSADDSTYTASAFVDEKGTVNAASGLDALNGTATYQGGAAGKYALASSTGGTNDAGHFTARATLKANFTNNTAETAITGTIDMFIGADGQSRDWKIALGGSTIGDTGMIGDATNGTTWSMGEDDDNAAASGQWSGMLRNNGDDGVPKVATGTFYSTYGTAGKMVGAFGANKQ